MCQADPPMYPQFSCLPGQDPAGGGYSSILPSLSEVLRQKAKGEEPGQKGQGKGDDQRGVCRGGYR